MEPDMVAELLRRFPEVRLDHDNKHYYQGLLEHRLLLNRCAACGHWQGLPPRPMCPRCWSTEVSAEPVMGEGRVALVTRLHRGPKVEGVSYDPPYPLVAVELVEQKGLRVSGTVIDAGDHLHIGQRVRLTWTKRAHRPLPAFTPAPEPGA